MIYLLLKYRISFAASSDDGDDVEDEDDIQYVSISDIIEQADTDSDLYLPPQVRCAAHTLNLICTTDADKALTEDKPYSRIYHGSFAKCQALWNAVKRSSKAADTVKEICSGKMIICPCLHTLKFQI